MEFIAKEENSKVSISPSGEKFLILDDSVYAVKLARLEILIDHARVEGKEILAVTAIHLQKPSLRMLLRNSTY